MGGGKRKSFNKSKPRRPQQSLFVEGGILAGYDSPHPITSIRGKNSDGKSGKVSVSNSKPGLRTYPAYDFRYDYPSNHPQDVSRSESCSGDKMVDGGSIESRPIVLLDTKDNQIVAYEDPAPSMEASEVAYGYEYGSGFVLGESSHSGLGYSGEPDTTAGVIDDDEEAEEEEEAEEDEDEEEEEFHRGLGFSTEPETAASVVVLSSTTVHGDQDPSYDSCTNEIEDDDDDDEGFMDEDDSRLVQDFLDEPSSHKKNSAFVSIGGVRVYTQDISDSESDEDDEELSDEDSSTDSSASDDSESDASGFDSDVDEDVMEDYLEGIGGTSQILNSKWLALQNLDGQEVDDNSDGYVDTLKKFSGVALQEASTGYGKYGKQKQPTKKKTSAYSRRSKASVDWDPSLDDMIFAKDPRRLSAKKNQVTRFPQSWPETGKSKKFSRRYPGEKKKHRKEMIAVKRRERMLHRGVDLEKINSKLKQMVINNTDMLGFQPMHARDCSQVQRLAAIYRLKSGCQGSGKKRFVTVSRTQHTCMPSASDETRLEKLIGGSKDDGDFPVVDTPRRVNRGPARSKSTDNSANRQGSSGKVERKRSGKKQPPADYASQPVSFVPSGVIQSETVQVSVVESNDNSNQEKSKDIASSSNSSMMGSFEVHTKGFGSKMMAKMGYVEGEGLGKNGKGMSHPIEVIQRPKSLGLGMSFVETTTEPVKVSLKRNGGLARNATPNTQIRGGSGRNVTPSTQISGGSGRNVTPNTKISGGSSRKVSPGIGSFEKHTKGFGSKMMAKMGFIEGTGLGRDSQGIITPLTAVRRPRARGLGAEGKS